MTKETPKQLGSWTGAYLNVFLPILWSRFWTKDSSVERCS